VLADDGSQRDVRISERSLHDADEAFLSDERPRGDERDAMSLQARKLTAERRYRPWTPVDESRIRVRKEPAHGVVILRTP
jgi:hypothetical protein